MCSNSQAPHKSGLKIINLEYLCSSTFNNGSVIPQRMSKSKLEENGGWGLEKKALVCCNPRLKDDYLTTSLRVLVSTEA